MEDRIQEMFKKVNALDGITQIQQTWATVVDKVTDEERAQYVLMLETAKFFMMKGDFARVLREYKTTHLFLLNIQLRGENAA
jgi:hypothetical protein